MVAARHHFAMQSDDVQHTVASLKMSMTLQQI
jgi:hypothetical protein